ncbi:MAG TPA: M3 family metallopeptidase, partial [Pirellulales bacterium]|nr:M3 family metallopeptidase [Pirellulales bacterium]
MTTVTPTSALPGESLPRWDVSKIFSSLEGNDYRAAFSELEAALADFEAFCDVNGIRRLSDPVDLLNSDAMLRLRDVLTTALQQANNMARQYETLEAFIYAFYSTNSYDAIAGRETSRLEVLETRRQQLAVRLKGWIGSLGDILDELIPGEPVLAEHAFFLRDTAEQSRFLMSEPLEALASELALDGGSAFSKLQGNVTSQLKVSWEQNGRVEALPITVIRNLSFDHDPAVRKRAYEAELQGWASIRTTVAACLNGVKGTAATLAKRRGWPSVLDAALEQNRIDRPTLDALLGTIREAFPLFRRYLRAKAQKLGQSQLAWWDLFAPVGAAQRVFTWPEATNFIVEKFGSFSGELGAFAQRSFDESWIDAEPRDGKRGGAFCMPVVGADESRVLMNFDGSFEQVSTLAHELGHAYHNECQSGLPPLRRGAPSTLAETASIFCETLIA